MKKQTAVCVCLLEEGLLLGCHHCSVGNLHKKVERHVRTLDKLYTGNKRRLPGREGDI